MEAPEVRLEASGEVSERNELLSGAFQVVLDGIASLDVAGGGTWTCAASLAWQLGREGEVPLAEGDLTLEEFAGAEGSRELFAVLETGTAHLDPDTGAATLRARFTVDGASGAWVAAGDAVQAEFEVGAEEWQGRIWLAVGAR